MPPDERSTPTPRHDLTLSGGLEEHKLGKQDIWRGGDGKEIFATISEGNFENKFLSAWHYNIAVGCNHGCRFSYVPESSTNKLKGLRKEYGVDDPSNPECDEQTLMRR